ncbi:unnamed protein product [Lasius platythorax]|uniref:Uncharacterized protein n=1 Tax=Lasius platythorax TaxID=488582 RepID=A0AAV2NI48_9HYME
MDRLKGLRTYLEARSARFVRRSVVKKTILSDNVPYSGDGFLLTTMAPIISGPSKRTAGYTAHFLPTDRYVPLLVFSLLPGANFQWQFPRVETIVQRLLLRP